MHKPLSHAEEESHHLKRVSWEVLTDSTLVLPDRQGVMEFRTFSSGILLVTSSIETRQNIVVDFPHDPNGRHVSAQFFMQGSAKIKLGNGTRANWEQDGAAIIRSDTPGFQLLVPAHQKLKHVCVGMYQHVIAPKLGDQVSEPLETLVFSEGPVDLVDEIAASPALREIAHDLFRRHRNGGVDKILSESLAMRFLGEALDTYDVVLDRGLDGAVSALSGPTPDAAVRALKTMIDETPNRRIAPEAFRDLFGMSQSRLRQAFRDQLHVSVGEYRRSVLLLQARQALLEGRRTIKEISFEAGYGHVGNFTRAYRTEFGENPSDTRRQAE